MFEKRHYESNVFDIKLSFNEVVEPFFGTPDYLLASTKARGEKRRIAGWGKNEKKEFSRKSNNKCLELKKKKRFLVVYHCGNIGQTMENPVGVKSRASNSLQLV